MFFSFSFSVSFDELDCICGVLFLLFVKAKRNILRLLFRVSSCLNCFRLCLLGVRNEADVYINMLFPGIVCILYLTGVLL